MGREPLPHAYALYCVQVGYQMGFHWRPSMKMLHMHAISRDFVGSGLKRREHYQSFNTEFFRDVEMVIQELRDTGRAHIDMVAINCLLRPPLKCLWCKAAMQNLPAVKMHIGTCLRNPAV
jgi:aprataxin